MLDCDVEGLRSLRKGARVRSLAEPLDDRDQAAVQPEPPTRAHPRKRRRPTRVRVCAVPEERASPEGGLVPSDAPIGVVLVEDNDVFRETLELLLDVTPDLQVVASVPDGRSALDVCQRVDPDVVVMDYRLPELDGVEVTGAIRRACPQAAVVVLTGGADERE